MTTGHDALASRTVPVGRALRVLLRLPAGFLRLPDPADDQAWRAFATDHAPGVAADAPVIALQRVGAQQAAASGLSVMAILPGGRADVTPGATLTLALLADRHRTALAAAEGIYRVEVARCIAETGGGDEVTVDGLAGQEGPGWLALTAMLSAGPACLLLRLRELQLPEHARGREQLTASDLPADDPLRRGRLAAAVGQVWIPAPTGSGVAMLTLTTPALGALGPLCTALAEAADGLEWEPDVAHDPAVGSDRRDGHARSDEQ